MLSTLIHYNTVYAGQFGGCCTFIFMPAIFALNKVYVENLKKK